MLFFKFMTALLAPLAGLAVPVCSGITNEGVNAVLPRQLGGPDPGLLPVPPNMPNSDNPFQPPDQINQFGSQE